MFPLRVMRRYGRYNETLFNLTQFSKFELDKCKKCIVFYKETFGHSCVIFDSEKDAEKELQSIEETLNTLYNSSK